MRMVVGRVGKPQNDGCLCLVPQLAMPLGRPQRMVFAAPTGAATSDHDTKHAGWRPKPWLTLAPRVFKDGAWQMYQLDSLEDDSRDQADPELFEVIDGQPHCLAVD